MAVEYFLLFFSLKFNLVMFTIYFRTASSAVDRGFIGDVMVSVLASSVVDRGFIGDVMVSVLASSAVDRGFEP